MDPKRHQAEGRIGLDRPHAMRFDPEGAEAWTPRLTGPAGDARAEPSSTSVRGRSPSGMPSGVPAATIESFLRALLDGHRERAREALEAVHQSHGAQAALEGLLWPACSALHDLSRGDRITAVAEHCATVLLSQMVQRCEERLAAGDARHAGPEARGLVLATSGPSPFEEIAGEIFAALAEAAGFEVLFLAGGVESDDLLAEVGRRQPDFVVSFAAAGADAPRLRRFLNALRTQQPVPGVLVGVGGGVFGRAPGLAEELGADFEGGTPAEVVAAMLALSGPRTGKGAVRRRAA